MIVIRIINWLSGLFLLLLAAGIGNYVVDHLKPPSTSFSGMMIWPMSTTVANFLTVQGLIVGGMGLLCLANAKQLKPYGDDNPFLEVLNYLVGAVQLATAYFMVGLDDDIARYFLAGIAVPFLLSAVALTFRRLE